MVWELDLTLDDIGLAVAGYYTSGGLGPDLLRADDFTDLVSETVEDVVEYARWFPAGTLVGRRLDHIRVHA
ncbi:hypothetical protein SAMN05661080_02755 [Modestobacter sp. DSM 44400]|uniref:DUF7715 family protein n=1 Tax=Modestobacter sp. DSM 44400 TaxID=1550230 RepID=UPI0008984D81|nr:hypothetical protein [Modestobacter sp. DSM 44400]SDY22666.1 hypothetical protein SAMN05661080_02755 [Modestobacter sp. DSM 44400]